MPSLRRLHRHRSAPARASARTGLLIACSVTLALAIAATQAFGSPASAKPTAKAATKAQPKAPAKPPPFEFAVLGNTPFNNTEVPVARSVLASIGDSDAAFVVHAGNLKNVGESCRDDLITQRLSLLASSPKPMIYVPGANDWADCERASDGSYNPVERLDYLRDHAFDDDALLGPGPVGYAQFDLTRQSDMARFRQYHENVRWFYRGVVFVGVNLPGNNNNYRSAGGRNGEFEDRVIATRVWLQHALVYAQQKDAIGMVIVAQADPEFEPVRSSGLKGIFSDRNGRRGVDGYKDFRTQLQRLAARFKAPILLIDSGKTMHHTQPLRDAHGALVKSFTQLSTYGSPAANRWVRVTVDPRKSQLFSFESATLPANSPTAPAVNGPRPGSAASASSLTSNVLTGATGTAASAPQATPTMSAAPYSALYPASGLSTNSPSVSSDPNQGVMPIGPALLPSAASHAPTRGK
ncbi:MULTISPECIES: hypothetical protein [Pandoraea]|uniref:hypothetical protein n=1 Tax=Pandoraea TaxID=93217 RepID=UPI001F5DB412|nr:MULTISPECIES: hypothetical protein [Pandoraea]MCI3204787.1 hypothetical protein [Pandoraea sp. LA3]MDN4582815.1 hypothetical protein [Pandoraea capi]